MGYLRLFMAICVMIGHARIFGYLPKDFLFNVRPGGWQGAIAVHFFFILSGFFCHLLITEKFHGLKAWPGRFLASRGLRLLPAYFLTFAATLLAVWLMPDAAALRPQVRLVHHMMRDPWDFILENIFFINVMFFTTEFRQGTWQMLVHPAWTLQMELIFLLLAPWLVTRSNRVLTIITLIAIAASGLYFFHGIYRWHILADFVYFVLGIVAYRAYVRLKPHAPLLWRYQWIGYAIIGVIMLWHLHFRLTALWLGIKPAYLALSLLMLIATPLLFVMLKSNPIERFTGDMAYPAYLTHFLLLKLVAISGLAPHKSSVFLIALPVCLLISALLVYYMDYPIMRYRRKLENKSRP